MKKLLIVLFILMLLCSCNKEKDEIIEENTNNVSTGLYKICNSLDAKVTELYLYETNSKDKGINHAGKDGLDVGDNITLSYDGTEKTVLTLEYIDENGDTGKFDTLIIEEATMTLIAEDARTGPTIVSFGDYQ